MFGLLGAHMCRYGRVLATAVCAVLQAMVEVHVQAYQMINPLNTKPATIRKLSYTPS